MKRKRKQRGGIPPIPSYVFLSLSLQSITTVIITLIFNIQQNKISELDRRSIWQVDESEDSLPSLLSSLTSFSRPPQILFPAILLKRTHLLLPSTSFLIINNQKF